MWCLRRPAHKPWATRSHYVFRHDDDRRGLFRAVDSRWLDRGCILAADDLEDAMRIPGRYLSSRLPELTWTRGQGRSGKTVSALSSLQRFSNETTIDIKVIVEGDTDRGS